MFIYVSVCADFVSLPALLLVMISFCHVSESAYLFVWHPHVTVIIFAKRLYCYHKFWFYNIFIIFINYHLSKVKTITTNSTNWCFYFKRRVGRVSSVHFQALMMKKIVASITISEPQLVIIVMVNLMIRRK